MKITKNKDNLIVTIPLKQKINNCYMDDKDLYDTDNLIGVIAGQDYSISQLNDLNYKDAQQEGSPIIMFGDEEELRATCKIANIDIWEHETCSECDKVLYGAFTLGNNGPICFDCERKHKKEDKK